ncbi:MAG: GxxExxY protein [Bacteroidetes bacterium]|nr:GxxExxY protein [Bacteroidota bacterium]
MTSENHITGVVIDCALKIHRRLGPGLLESAYEHTLAYELNMAGLKFERQVPIPIVYESVKLEMGYRADMIVENRVILEIKSVEQVLPVHAKQLLTYLRLADVHVGLLINFNVELIKFGIRRIVNKLE